MFKKGAIAVAALLAILTQNACAHPELKKSEPAQDESVNASKEIRLTFSEGLIAKFYGVELRNKSGKGIETGLASAEGSDRKQLVVPLKSPLVPS